MKSHFLIHFQLEAVLWTTLLDNTKKVTRVFSIFKIDEIVAIRQNSFKISSPYFNGYE
jgi:hypothetical protein